MSSSVSILEAARSADSGERQLPGKVGNVDIRSASERSGAWAEGRAIQVLQKAVSVIGFTSIIALGAFTGSMGDEKP